MSKYGKYGPEKTPHLDTSHVVISIQNRNKKTAIVDKIFGIK